MTVDLAVAGDSAVMQFIRTADWQHASIALLSLLLLLALGVRCFAAWHRARYVRRRRAPMHAVCSPAVTRAFIRSFGGGR